MFKNSLQTSVVYRFDTFAFLASEMFALITFFYLWSTIYRTGQEVGSYGLRGIVTYYLLAIFLGGFIKSTDIAWRVGDDIRFGYITNYLLKPLDYEKTMLAVVLARACFNLAAYFLIIVFAFVFLGNYLAFSFSWLRLGYFMGAVILGFLINYLFFFIVGISAFWFGYIFGFNFILSTIAGFLSGSIVPLDLLPGWLVNLNVFLPFQYILYVPISILSGKAPFNLYLLFIPFCWVLFLYFLSRFLFLRGVKRYEGFGI